MLLIGFAFAVAAPIAAHGNRPGLHNLLDFYFAAGWQSAAIDSVALIYRPPLLDILPMYIVLLALTPLALIAARRMGWKFVMAGSFTFWLLAQFGFRQVSYDFLAQHFGLQIPLNAMGAFDVWGWQIVWFLGLWCGVRWAKNDLPLEQWAKRLLIPAILVAMLAVVMRYAVGLGMELGRFAGLIDKWHMGAARIIDFAAVTIILVRAQDHLKRVAIRPLVLLGQSSLQVFCAHLLFCFAGLTLMGNASMLSGAQQVVLLAATFSGLFVVAKLCAKDTRKAPAGQARTTAKPAAGAVRARALVIPRLRTDTPQ